LAGFGDSPSRRQARIGIAGMTCALCRETITQHLLWGPRETKG